MESKVQLSPLAPCSLRCDDLEARRVGRAHHYQASARVHTYRFPTVGVGDATRSSCRFLACKKSTMSSASIVSQNS